MEIGDKVEGKKFDYHLRGKSPLCYIFRIRTKEGEHKGSVTVYKNTLAVITIALEPTEYVDLHIDVFEFYINLEIK